MIKGKNLKHKYKWPSELRTRKAALICCLRKRPFPRYRGAPPVPWPRSQAWRHGSPATADSWTYGNRGAAPNVCIISRTGQYESLGESTHVCTNLRRVRVNLEGGGGASSSTGGSGFGFKRPNMKDWSSKYVLSPQIYEDRFLSRHRRIHQNRIHRQTRRVASKKHKKLINKKYFAIKTNKIALALLHNVFA